MRRCEDIWKSAVNPAGWSWWDGLKMASGVLLILLFSAVSSQAQNPFDLAPRSEKTTSKKTIKVTTEKTKQSTQGSKISATKKTKLTPQKTNAADFSSADSAISESAPTDQRSIVSNQREQPSQASQNRTLDTIETQKDQNPFSLAARAEEDQIRRSQKNGLSRVRRPVGKEKKPKRRKSTATVENTRSSSGDESDEETSGDKASDDSGLADRSEFPTETLSEAAGEDGKETEESRVTEIFGGEVLGDAHIGDTKINQKNKSFFLFWLLLLISLLTSIIVYLERTTVIHLFRSLANGNFLNLLFRKRNPNTNLIYSILYIIFLANASIFAFLCLRQWLAIQDYLYLLYCLIGISLIYILKHFTILGIGWVYRIDRLMRSYSFSIIVFNAVGGLLLLPINFFMAFSQQPIASTAMIIGLVIVVSLLLLRTFRSVLSALPTAAGSQIHFLLYLCTVEIMPLMVLWKTLS